MNTIPTLSWASLPTALRGAARTVDMFGKLDEYRTSPNADLEMIRNDWIVVGNALRLSMQSYEQSPEQTQLAESTCPTK